MTDSTSIPQIQLKIARRSNHPMHANPKQPQKTRVSYMFDAIPEDDDRQTELNRRLRKPGESAACAPSGNANAYGPAGSATAESRNG